MTEIDIDVMPKAVWRLYQLVLDLTEVAPVVERNGYGCMVLKHGNERVQVTVTFKNPNWEWRWRGSTLRIDGEKVPIATSPEHYAAIFANPDEGRYGYTPKGAKKAKLPEMRLLDEGQIPYAPKIIGSTVKQLMVAVTDENTQIKTYIVDKDNEYVILIENSVKGNIYQFIGQSGEMSAKTGNRWALVDIRITNPRGYDISMEHADSLETFLMDILGADSRKNQQSYIPEGSARSQAGMSNSVAVRKATVFRV